MEDWQSPHLLKLKVPTKEIVNAWMRAMCEAITEKTGRDILQALEEESDATHEEGQND